jgi:RimJ/RimL family protein N-acetyltransferase
MALIEAKSVTVRSGSAVIRAATPEDAAQLEVLNQAIDRETEFLMRSPGEFTLTLDEHRQFIAKTRDSKRNLLLVAELNGSMVGLLLFTGSHLARFQHQGDFAIAVLRDSWGQGLGRALVSVLLQWADEVGILRVGLRVAVNNSRAIDLYKSMGFHTEGILRAERMHLDGPQDTLVMARVRVCDPLPEPGTQRR